MPELLDSAPPRYVLGLCLGLLAVGRLATLNTRPGSSGPGAAALSNRRRPGAVVSPA